MDREELPFNRAQRSWVYRWVPTDSRYRSMPCIRRSCRQGSPRPSLRCG